MEKRNNNINNFYTYKTNDFIKLVCIFVALLLLISGCGKPKTNFKSESDVLKYLEREYKDETFEIISHEKITLSDQRNCEGESLEGDSYTVKSLMSNITFTVKDLYYYNMLYCSAIKYDDYLNKAIEKYSANLDSKIEITYASRAYTVPTLGVSLSDFKTDNDAMIVMNNFSIELSKKAPFRDGIKYVNFRVCKGSLMSSKCNNITTIDAKSADKILDLIDGLKGV